MSGENEHYSNTGQAIRQAALELFSTQGFEKTSMREIAERLGVTKAALYYHFPSKAALVRSLIGPGIAAIEELLAGNEQRTPQALFEDLLDVLVEHLPTLTALIVDASALAYLDIEQRAIDWFGRIPVLLAGPDADPARQVRAVVAFSGLAQFALFALDPDTDSNTDPDTTRAAAVAAACAALAGHDTTEQH